MCVFSETCGLFPSCTGVKASRTLNVYPLIILEIEGRARPIRLFSRELRSRDEATQTHIQPPPSSFGKCRRGGTGLDGGRERKKKVSRLHMAARRRRRDQPSSDHY
jgi:hypothetical protein